MKRLLQLALGTEVVLGVVWSFVAAMAGGLEVVGLFFIVYALFAAFFAFAAWAFWKHPDQRRLAGWIMALPFAFWFSPAWLRTLAGGVVSHDQLVSAVFVVVIAAIAAAWLFPRKVVAWVPSFLVRSRLFNWLILLSVISGWLFMVLVVLYVAHSPRALSSSTDSGMALAYAVVLAATYLLGLGLASFGASTWAWLSLRGGVERTARKLNIAQLVVATPGVLIGVLVAAWLTGQGHL